MWSARWVSHVSATHNEKDLWYIRLRVTYEKKLQTLVPSLNVNVNTKTKLRTPTVTQSRELQQLIRTTRSVIARITTGHELGKLATRTTCFDLTHC